MFRRSLLAPRFLPFPFPCPSPTILTSHPRFHSFRCFSSISSISSSSFPSASSSSPPSPPPPPPSPQSFPLPLPTPLSRHIIFIGSGVLSKFFSAYLHSIHNIPSTSPSSSPSSFPSSSLYFHYLTSRPSQVETISRLGVSVTMSNSHRVHLPPQYLKCHLDIPSLLSSLPPQGTFTIPLIFILVKGITPLIVTSAARNAMRIITHIRSSSSSSFSISPPPLPHVVSLMNGLFPLTLLPQMFSNHKYSRYLHLGITNIGAYYADGEIRHAAVGETMIGEGEGEGRAKGNSEEIKNIITNLFHPPSLPHLPSHIPSLPFTFHPSFSIPTLIWSKLLVNAVVNPLTALYNVRNDQLLIKGKEVENLMKSIVKEVVEVGRKEGIQWESIVKGHGNNMNNLKDPLNPPSHPRDSDSASDLDSDPLVSLCYSHVLRILHVVKHNYSSMYQDINKKNSTEIESILGEVIRLGKKWGVKCEVIKEIREEIYKLQWEKRHGKKNELVESRKELERERKRERERNGEQK